MRQVQCGPAPFSREVESILRTPRIDIAAEQFVRGIVNILRECVVRAEIQPLREPVHEIHRTGMINPDPQRRVRRQVPGKSVRSRQQRPVQLCRQEVVEISQRARGRRHS